MIEIPSKIESVEMEEGEGARVKRLFPTHRKNHCDPFVLMDEFFLNSTASFPTHYHRGFESITYLFQGSVRHQDSIGNDSILNKGESQTFVTGQGVSHSEMPHQSELSHGIQLWINLPKKLKVISPSYNKFDSSKLPEKIWNGGRIRTICGPNSPLRLSTPLIFQEVVLTKGQSLQATIPESYSSLIYLVRGLMESQESLLNPGEALYWKATHKIDIRAQEESHFIILSGLPHHETFQINGTCVD